LAVRRASASVCSRFNVLTIQRFNFSRWIRMAARMERLDGVTLQRGLLPALLDARGFRVFAILEFAVALSKLLLDFFRDLVDGGVEIAIVLLGVQIGAAHPKPERAFELALGRLGVVVFEIDSGVNGPAIEMLQLIDAYEDVVLDGLGQRDIMRRQDEFHGPRM